MTRRCGGLLKGLKVNRGLEIFWGKNILVSLFWVELISAGHFFAVRTHSFGFTCLSELIYLKGKGWFIILGADPLHLKLC